MLAFSVIGARLAFALPLNLRANWIFRIMPPRDGRDYLTARRRAPLAVGVLPVWTASSGLVLSAWPWLPAIGHAIVLGLLGAIFTELALRGIQKIPFTCSVPAREVELPRHVLGVLPDRRADRDEGVVARTRGAAGSGRLRRDGDGVRHAADGAPLVELARGARTARWSRDSRRNYPGRWCR